MAETGWLPTPNADVAPLVATPPTSVTAVPKLDPSTRNCTVPVGVPLDEVTVAVKVIDWPKAEGFAEEASAVAVPPEETFWPPARPPELLLKPPVAL